MAPQPAGGTMREIDVAGVIERQKLNMFVVRLVILSWIITVFDGFDMLAISFVAPYLQSDFALDKVKLGEVFSLGLAGTMVGGFLFGYLGDRLGRRPAIILSTFSFGILTVALALARSIDQLLLLRFLNGVALGGMLPLCWALNIEFVPRAYRSTVVTLIMLGYTAGGAIAGPTTVAIAPHFGWQGVFVFGGLASLVAGGVLIFALPESVRYLTARQRRPQTIARTVNRLEPGMDASDSEHFYLSDEAGVRPRFNMRVLFEGRLAIITPLLWMAYIASSLAIFFMSSWGPLVFEAIGFTRTEAAFAASVNSVGSAIGGLVLMRFTDRFGPIAIAVLPAIGVPLLLLAGLGDLSRSAFLVTAFLAMMMLGGTHFGMHSIAGIFYPSAFRANGTGWATSVAKFGSVAGPLIGGYILSSQLPVRATFALLAVCPLATAICVGLLGLAHRRRPAEDEGAALADTSADTVQAAPAKA